jgi:hypothetical protein
MGRSFHPESKVIIAGMLMASLGAVGCGGSSSRTTSTRTGATTAASPPAAATAPIAPASLVAPAADLHGFSGSGTPQVATSARRWVEVGNMLTPAEVATEVAKLDREGFREGVGEHYSGASGQEAVSLALVFHSAQGARQEFDANLAVDQHRFGMQLEPVKIAAIPGSVLLGAGPDGNVVFTTGRCYLLVGDELRGSTSQAQVNAAPIAAATALYRRVKRLCV